MLDCEYNILVFILVLTLMRPLGATTPQNVAALLGQTVDLYLDTPTNNYVYWIEYITIASGANIFDNGGYVYTGNAATGARYSTITSTSGSTVSHVFSVSNLELTDGGQYSADDLLGNTSDAAEIIVLDSDIACTMSPNPVEAGSVVSVSCSITYQGRWRPVLTCSSSDLTSTATSDTSVTGLSQITYTGTAASGTVTGTVTCDASFQNPVASELSANEASNVPSYTSSWSGNVNIYFPATAISITPDQSTFSVDDVITCSATGGNPAPSYEWHDVDASTLLASTSELTVSQDMAGLGFNVKCTATTSISGVDHQLTDITQFTVTAGLSKTTIVIITVPTVLGVLAIIAIALAVVFCMKKKKANQTQESPDTHRKNAVSPSEIHSPETYYGQKAPISTLAH